MSQGPEVHPQIFGSIRDSTINWVRWEKWRFGENVNRDGCRWIKDTAVRHFFIIAKRKHIVKLIVSFA